MTTTHSTRPALPIVEGEAGRPPLVLFDWNGTVMDDVARAAAAANQAVAPYGLTLTAEEFQAGFTLPLRTWLSDVGVPHDSTAQAADRWNRAMEVAAPARASARQTIGSLRELGAVTGVVTAAAPGSVRADLDSNDFDGMFDYLCTDVDDKVECLRSLRHVGEQAVYVGDTAYDIVSAKSAGFTAVSIGGGYQCSATLAEAQPDHHIEDLADLLPLVLPVRAV